jgi:hypothetical protein
VRRAPFHSGFALKTTQKRFEFRGGLNNNSGTLRKEAERGAGDWRLQKRNL